MIVVITDDDLLLPYLLPWFVATIKTNYPSAEVTEGVTGCVLYKKLFLNVSQNYPRGKGFNGNPLDNYPGTISLGELTPIKFSSRQLLRSVSSWVVLSLNFTLAKQVLQLRILAEGAL